MNIIKMNIHNSREGILTIDNKNSLFSCISDQKICEGDVIMHPEYSKVLDGDVQTFVVESILEERPSRGEWKSTPSTWRNISFKKERIPGRIMKELGYLQTEEYYDEKGKKATKTFIQF